MPKHAMEKRLKDVEAREVQVPVFGLVDTGAVWMVHLPTTNSGMAGGILWREFGDETCGENGGR
jgi:hypothetical protein